MAVNDEQFMKVKHVKGAVNKLRQEMAELDVDVPQATTSVYGTVKLISDEDWEAYTSDPIGADSDSLDLSPGSDFTYSSFSFKASCSNGTVSISGSGSFASRTINANTNYELFSLPEGYAPSSEQTHSVTMNGYSATATVDTNGVVTIRSSTRRTGINRISFSTTWTFDIVTSEVPTFADNVTLTVEQFKNLIGGGSSGGGSSSGGNSVVLFEGNSNTSVMSISANIHEYSRIEIYCNTEGAAQMYYFEAPFNTGNTAQTHDPPVVTFTINEIYGDGFRIYVSSSYSVTVTKVVGIE